MRTITNPETTAHTRCVFTTITREDWYGRRYCARCGLPEHNRVHAGIDAGHNWSEPARDRD